MKQLIEALQYMLKFIKNPEERLVACEHDIMRIWDVDVKAMTLDDVKKLYTLGFNVGDTEYDDYYIWDCCAGTGNLLNGLTNYRKVWASTLDKQDVDVMKDRIHNGWPMFENHVFQFDFLNDSFDKCPEELRAILNDENERKKLVIYINPPYAEAGNEKTATGTGENKRGVSKENFIYEKYKSLIGKAQNEIYALFLIRIYIELQNRF